MKESLVRIVILLAITIMLFPILLGGIAGQQRAFLRVRQAMRQEHQAALARDRARRALRLRQERSQGAAADTARKE